MAAPQRLLCEHINQVPRVVVVREAQRFLIVEHFVPRARSELGELARPAIDLEPPQDLGLPLEGRLQRHKLVPGAELIGVGVATQPLSEHKARGVAVSVGCRVPRRRQ